MTTASKIKTTANTKGYTTATVIPSQFEEVEYLAVNMGNFRTAFFLMNNETFDYSYSHTYDARIGKTTKRIPKGF